MSDLLSLLTKYTGISVQCIMCNVHKCTKNLQAHYHITQSILSFLII